MATIYMERVKSQLAVKNDPTDLTLYVQFKFCKNLHICSKVILQTRKLFKFGEDPEIGLTPTTLSQWFLNVLPNQA